MRLDVWSVASWYRIRCEIRAEVTQGLAATTRSAYMKHATSSPCGSPLRARREDSGRCRSEQIRFLTLWTSPASNPPSPAEFRISGGRAAASHRSSSRIGRHIEAGIRPGGAVSPFKFSKKCVKWRFFCAAPHFFRPIIRVLIEGS